MLIDSHCHLESFYRKGCLEEVLQYAKEAGVGQMITIGTSKRDWDLYRLLTTRYKEQVAYTAGLHPTDIDENWEEQLDLLASFFKDEPVPLGIGEVGLDHFHLPKSESEAEEVKSRQVVVFKLQLKLASQLNCPVVVHSRNSFQECVDVIDESGIDWSKIVFHCFADGPDEIQLLNERGGRGSFTGIITYKNAEKVRNAALAQGLDTLMVETDAPYLAPMPMRGKRNEPAFVQYTADFCADLFQVDREALASQTTANVSEFFNLH